MHTVYLLLAVSGSATVPESLVFLLSPSLREHHACLRKLLKVRCVRPFVVERCNRPVSSMKMRTMFGPAEGGTEEWWCDGVDHGQQREKNDDGRH